MNRSSEYWSNLKSDFGETMDERFLYILCSDYERYEDMTGNNKLNHEVDAKFYQERLDLLLKTKESQLEKLIQVHANEIIKHRKLFYESIDIKYANRKYSTINTLSSMILHPEVEKILINGKLMDPSQHGITESGKGKIGTMEDIENAIRRKLSIKDDEPIIGGDELYRQYYSELDKLKERQEKELRDFLTFYKREQEYFEKCITKIKDKKPSDVILSTNSFKKNITTISNNFETTKFRAEYNARSGIQVPPKKSKVTFITLDSDQRSSSIRDDSTLSELPFNSSVVEYSTSNNSVSVPTVSLSNDSNSSWKESDIIIPKTVSIDMNKQQIPPLLNHTQSPSLPSPLFQPSITNNNNSIENNVLNPGAIQILNMLGNTIQQDNININEVLRLAEKLFNNGSQKGSQ